MKQILAIFDFCETIVDIQSISPFLDLAHTHNRAYRSPHSLKGRILRKGARIVYKALYDDPLESCAATQTLTRAQDSSKRDPHCSKLQTALASLSSIPTYPELAGLPLETAQNLATDYALSLHNHCNHTVIDKLLWHQDRGHSIVIVSGGLGIYIRPFMQKFGIDHILAVELESTCDNNGQQTLSGNRCGLHTMQERKLYALADHLRLEQYDLTQSYAYSDCPSDIPLLSLVGKPSVIQASHNTRWASILGYSIIAP